MGEGFERILRSASVENIGQLITALPDSWRPQFVEYIGYFRNMSSVEQLVTIDAGCFRWESEPSEEERRRMRSEYEAESFRKRERFFRVVVPAIQSWFHSRPDG